MIWSYNLHQRYSLVTSVRRQKRESQNECFMKTKDVKLFEKRTFFYSWYIHARTCAYHGIKNVRFLWNLACFVFSKHTFWGLSFCLITNEKRLQKIMSPTWSLNYCILYRLRPYFFGDIEEKRILFEVLSSQHN